MANPTINPEALQLLQSDVAQIKQDIEGVNESIRGLETRRLALQFKLAMYEEKLGNYKPEQSPASAGNGETSQISSSAKVSFGASGTLHDAGMRDAVRAVLADSGKGLNTAEIAKQMLARGFQYTASTDIKTRLSNELYRMAESGHVKKRRRQGKNIYLLSDEAS